MPASLAKTLCQWCSQTQCQHNPHWSPGQNYENMFISCFVSQGLRIELALWEDLLRGSTFYGRWQTRRPYKISAKGGICCLVIQMGKLSYSLVSKFQLSADRCCQKQQSIQWSDWSYLSWASCRSNSGWNSLFAFHLVGEVHFHQKSLRHEQIIVNVQVDIHEIVCVGIYPH